MTLFDKYEKEHYPIPLPDHRYDQKPSRSDESPAGGFDPPNDLDGKQEKVKQ